MTRYRGRFAPSPTGPLHAGSLVTALASWLDARAHHGVWLIRIENIDGPRTVSGSAEQILSALTAFGLVPDEPPIWQNTQTAYYEARLSELRQIHLAYPCSCTRKEIADSLTSTHERHVTLTYPGTCRRGLHGKSARAWRLQVPDSTAAIVTFEDRWQRQQTQNLATEVGDFVLRRADGQWAYQLAVVVDDAHADITHIVRGADLIDSTARQIYLQRCLGLPTPSYLHVPIVTDTQGDKLSKQTGAAKLDFAKPLTALFAAANHLGLALEPAAQTSLAAFYRSAIAAWARRFDITPR